MLRGLSWMSRFWLGGETFTSTICIDSMIMISSMWKDFWNIFNYLWMIVIFLWKCKEIEGLNVWKSRECNCLMIAWCQILNKWDRSLNFINMHGFPIIPLNSKSFTSKQKYIKSYWKLNVKHTLIVRGLMWMSIRQFLLI